ncbi:MAG: Hpt domain-containing protein [Proteobacteria bacterium]|nr:Hpt domain-containing protein [Pseudomonadota bacterium]
MARTKTEQPLLKTFADHEVIVPANPLRHAAVAARPDDEDPVARAEGALALLSSEFSMWMDLECKRLDAARLAVRARGFSASTHETLFHAAHDIKGEAATFGYPMVAIAAESLCRLIEHTPDMRRIPTPLVDQHVDAMRAIIRENGRPEAATVAVRLTRELREVTDAFLRVENRDRMHEMDGILSPPLAPDVAPEATRI